MVVLTVDETDSIVTGKLRDSGVRIDTRAKRCRRKDAEHQQCYVRVICAMRPWIGPGGGCTRARAPAETAFAPVEAASPLGTSRRQLIFFIAFKDIARFGSWSAQAWLRCEPMEGSSYFVWDWRIWSCAAFSCLLASSMLCCMAPLSICF